jgi:glutamate/tyrosine decarboxylase-like PLP-dependent enzyme
VALEARIQQEIDKGNMPLFVNAVAGSTVMGAFDDLEAIGKICKRCVVGRLCSVCVARKSSQ